MDRTSIIFSMSVVALLATSPAALATEPFKLKSNNTIGSKLLLDKPNLNLQKPTSPVVNGSTNAVKTGQGGGGLSGLGVPGGINTGSGFKGPNATSVMPKGTSGMIKDGVSGLKTGNGGQVLGVQSKDKISDRLAPGMIKAIKDANASKGQELGVQQNDGISAKLAPGMIKAIKDDQDSKGKEKGVQSGGDSYRLTPGQIQQMRDMTVNPKINQSIGSLDQLKFDPKDDKGAGKPAAPKPATGGTKPMTDKEREAAKKEIAKLFKPFSPKPDSTKDKKTGAIVSNKGGLIVFPAVVIKPTPTPKPTPPKPPKLEAISNPAMDRLN
jgi:hypothetical protein